jgi:hypothetical protein
MSNPLEFGLACIGALWVALCVVVGLSFLFEGIVTRYIARRMPPPPVVVNSESGTLLYQGTGDSRTSAVKTCRVVGCDRADCDRQDCSMRRDYVMSEDEMSDHDREAHRLCAEQIRIWKEWAALPWTQKAISLRAHGWTQEEWDTYRGTLS